MKVEIMDKFLIVEVYNKPIGYCDGGYKVIYESWLDTRIDKEIVGSFIAKNYNDAYHLFVQWQKGESK